MPDPINPYGFNPPPIPQPTVWPPPPSVQTGQPGQIPYLPFLFLYNRVSGNISDVREGSLGLQPNGLEIKGKAQIRQEITMPVVLVLICFCFWPGVIASMLFRYAFMQPIQQFLASGDITEIVIEPRTRRAGIAFNAPNYKGTVKPFCLCFQLAEDSFPVFASWAMFVAADRTHEGRLKSGTTLTTWAVTGVLLTLLIGLMAFAIYYSGIHH